MASKMPSSTPAPSSSRWIYYSLYLALSGTALYHMRLGPTSKTTGDHLEPLIAGSAPHFTYPGRHTVIRQRYTGITAVDGLLSVLVTAFLAGPAGWKKYIQVQQMNFLCSWTSVLVVWSVESVRSNVGWSLIAFTSLWALLYQTIGGAIIVPLYLIAFTYTTSRSPHLQLPASSSVPYSKATTLFPAVIIGFLLPTALMFYPFGNIDWTMLATALWQPSPIIVNIIWVLLSALTPNPTSASSRGANTSTSKRHVKAAYVLSGILSAISHLTTLYLCVTGIYPDVTFKSIFGTTPPPSGAPFDDSVHFVFQVDYLVIFIATTVWCFQAMSEARARTSSQASLVKKVQQAVMLLLGVVAIGPAATLSAVWYWREDKFGLAGGAAVKME